MREPPRPASERVKPLVALIKSPKPTNVGDWRNQRPVFVSQVPPCSVGCPAGEQIRDYIALVQQGKMAEAWRLIKEDNPIPAVMGRVCYHPCESPCHRAQYDEAIAIHSLERRIGDYGLEHGLKVEVGPAKKHRVAVIGSGPAGLSAAYQLARRGYGVTVFESAAKAGGMLRYGIPAYRLPRNVLDAEIGNVAAVGVEFVYGAKIGDTMPWERLREYAGVVVSAGCAMGRTLAIPGADRAGIVDGLSFLNAINSDGGAAVRPGSRVLVIGGGNVAIDAGRVAKRLGAGEVTLTFLESQAKMPAYPEEREDALTEGVAFLPGRHFLEFQGSNGRVGGVRCTRVNSFKFDGDGNLLVDTLGGTEHLLEADTIVVAVGQGADLRFVPSAIRGQWSELAAGGAVQSDGQWIVAAGDVVEGPSSVVRAVGAGKRVAAKLDALMQGRSLPFEETPNAVSFDRLNMAYFAPAARQQPPSRELNARAAGFDEVVGEMSEDAFVAEAKRCFHCGDCNYCSNCWVFCPESSIMNLPDRIGTNGLPRFQVDNVTCKGCGICVHECPRAAIVMEEEFQ